MYLAGNVTPRVNLELLDQMISVRTEIAETVGCNSYSEYKAISASLAQNPQGEAWLTVLLSAVIGL